MNYTFDKIMIKGSDCIDDGNGNMICEISHFSPFFPVLILGDTTPQETNYGEGGNYPVTAQATDFNNLTNGFDSASINATNIFWQNIGVDSKFFSIKHKLHVHTPYDHMVVYIIRSSTSV